MDQEQIVEAEVVEATAVATFPPKPDAIMTLLHSDSFLPGAQTLLYSVKKHLSNKVAYSPELVVLVTPDVSPQTHKQLEPFCTRVISVDDIHFPEHSIDSKIPKQEPLHRSLDNHCPGLTKLRIFQLQQYDTVLYLDCDCLVLKDVSPLLELNKIYVESEALIAAAPDVIPPDKFNSGVMVVRPNRKTFENMVGQSGLLATQDGSDTGFLNAYYPNWFQNMPPMARLEIGYNAQQVLHDLTISNKKTGASNYWDTSIAPTLSVVHYSNERKPWQEVLQEAGSSSSGSSTEPSKCKLISLWKQWHQKSQNFLARHLKRTTSATSQRTGASPSAAATTAKCRTPTACQ